uniref:(California timema) hypothetical protein n=1 Tax=Timema californicum TaxID=61474 RepID=A0A7R9PCS0_TIMCA|nr:unnamed protein product [Timema californicum]
MMTGMGMSCVSAGVRPSCYNATLKQLLRERETLNVASGGEEKRATWPQERRYEPTGLRRGVGMSMAPREGRGDETPQPVNMGSNILIVALTLCSVASSWGWREGSVVSEELFATANPDVYLTAPELIAKKGYPAETHSVTTEDGYILTLHRIPYGKSGPSNNRPAVLVQHGLLCSSDAWVIMEPEKSLDSGVGAINRRITGQMPSPNAVSPAQDGTRGSLPLPADVSLLVILEECFLVATSGQIPEGSPKTFILADAGYDVWLGNTRGSTYSKEHVSLQSTDNEFWDFSESQPSTCCVSKEDHFLPVDTWRGDSNCESQPSTCCVSKEDHFLPVDTWRGDSNCESQPSTCCVSKEDHFLPVDAWQGDSTCGPLFSSVN